MMVNAARRQAGRMEADGYNICVIAFRPRSAVVRLALAQVLIERLGRPRQALKVLARMDAQTLSATQRAMLSKLSERAAYLNSIIDESSFLWTQMFMDIEHLKPGGVRLLSISPKMVKGNMEVHLRVGATSDEAKLKFLRALEGSKDFAKVVVLNNQVATQPGGDQQTFELSLIYTRV